MAKKKIEVTLPKVKKGFRKKESYEVKVTLPKVQKPTKEKFPKNLKNINIKKSLMNHRDKRKAKKEAKAIKKASKKQNKT